MDSEKKSPELLTEAEHHLEQAYDYQEAGEFEEALCECNAAIEIDPSLADAYNLRGIVLEELDRKDEAVEAYRQAIGLDPEFHEARDNLSALEVELGEKRRLVTIATFSYPTQAHIPKTRLEAEGIWAFIADEHTITMNWLYSNAIGGVKLQVMEPDVERALEILNQEPVSIEMTDDELGEEEQRLECPRCQSAIVHYEKYNIRLVFLSWLLLNFPIPFLKRKWKCSDCGHEWKSKW